MSNIQPTSVRLSWFPPGYDGNSPIVSYVVDAKAGSNPWRQHVDNINPSDRQMSILVRNLLPHTQYQFRVKAVNQVGVGAASAASGSIVTGKAGKAYFLNASYLLNTAYSVEVALGNLELCTGKLIGSLNNDGDRDEIVT